MSAPARRLRLLPLVAATFFMVSGGPYGLEDLVQKAGYARALLVLAILFLLRDQWVSFLRSLGALHNLSAKANWSGKARTLISFPTICVIYYYLQAPTDWCLRFPASLVYGLEGLSVAINLISIGVYTARFWPALRAEMRLPDSGKQEKD